MTIGKPAALAALALAVLTACAGIASNQEQRTKATVRCGYSPAPAGFLVPGRVVLFGEYHGTKELPQAFGELACQAALVGPVQVGLEIPRGEADRLRAYLAAPDAPQRAQLLRASPYWTDSYQDGRRSIAMAALLTRLSALEAAGFELEVFPFDVDPPPGEDRDERMAEAIAEVAIAHPRANVMILVGNLHARTEPGADGSARPMGSFLKEAGLDVVAFDFAGPQGTAWTCPDANPAHCAIGVLKPGNAAGPSGIALDASMAQGFRGRWSVPSLSASPPSVRKP